MILHSTKLNNNNEVNYLWFIDTSITTCILWSGRVLFDTVYNEYIQFNKSFDIDMVVL